MSKVMVPVGLDLGPMYAADGPADRAPVHYEVHLGAESMDLDATRYTVWSAAFADADAQLNLKVDRSWLVDYLRDFGDQPVGRIMDANQTIDELLDLGLLLEYDPAAGDEIADLFGRHRLLPRALGLGSTPQLSDMFGMGYDTSRFCEMPIDVYTVWAFGPTVPTLWDACDIFAEGVDSYLPPGDGQVSYLSPGNGQVKLRTPEVVTSIAENLPLLLSTGSAFLDPLNYELPRIPEPVPFPADASSRTVRGRAPVIVPIGLPLGWDYWEGNPEFRPDQAVQVMYGAEYVDLTTEQAIAWKGATEGTMQQFARHEMTRSRLVDRLHRDHDIPDADAVVDSMLEQGQLVEYDPVEGPLEELFRAIQLFPLGRAHGNTATEPRLYGVSGDGDVKVGIQPEPYTIRSYAFTCASLWDACTTLAEGADKDLPPGKPPMDLTPESVARPVAELLPILVAAGSAFIGPLNYRS